MEPAVPSKVSTYFRFHTPHAHLASTFGDDWFGAKAEIFALMYDLVENGAAILMISSELSEIVNVCDRAYVMREGIIAGELSRERLSEENILQLGMHPE